MLDKLFSKLRRNGMITQLTVQVGAALFAWAFLVIASYICTVWCFSYQVVWHRVARWASVGIGGLALSLGVLYAISAQWGDQVTIVLLPALVCMIALHTLLITLRHYLMQRIPSQLHATRFYTTLVLLYAFFIGGSSLLISVKSPFLIDCVVLSLNYFMYAAIVATFILSRLIRRQF
jgi:hypothetical protein